MRNHEKIFQHTGHFFFSAVGTSAASLEMKKREPDMTTCHFYMWRMPGTLGWEPPCGILQFELQDISKNAGHMILLSCISLYQVVYEFSEFKLCAVISNEGFHKWGTPKRMVYSGTSH